MSRTSSEAHARRWDNHRHRVRAVGATKEPGDEALLGRSFHKMKTLPFKCAEAVKHVPEELLQLMGKPSVFQWEQRDLWAELYIWSWFYLFFLGKFWRMLWVSP